MRRLVLSGLILAAAGPALAQPAAKPAVKRQAAKRPAAAPAATDGGVDGAGDLARAADVAAELANVAPSGDDLAKAADAAAEVASLSASGTELAQAADATAAAASVPPPADPAAPAPAGKPADDIDLGALGLDPASASGFDDKLNLYGFADFSFSATHWSKLTAFSPDTDTRTFLLGSLNLYMAKNLTPRARALAEVRFTFLPNGSTNADGTVVDTTATDLVNYSRAVQWGGIVIERAYAEYDLTDHLTIRGGHWLTPYGIWNIDHGSPAIIPTSRPYIIGEQLFPEHQTGLDLFGSYPVEGWKIGYHATASNGRGATEAQLDQDSKLAFGGRLELETPWGLRLGGSYYRGRFTGVATTPGVRPETYREASYGGDALYDRGPLHVQGEVIVRQRSYDEAARAAAPPGLLDDAHALGFYGLAGYRLDAPWSPMPHVVYEDYRPINAFAYERVWAATAGINLRPAPSLVFKAGATYVVFVPGQGLLADTKLVVFEAQASWVF